MFRKVWRWLFGSYDSLVQERLAAQRESDLKQLIEEMEEFSQDIANGKWITDVGNNPPVIPERRRKVR